MGPHFSRYNMFSHSSGQSVFKNTTNFFGGFQSMFKQAQNILEQFNVFDCDEKGQKGVIDASEAKFGKGSIFFVEEGMTKQEFMNKNAIIWEASRPSMIFSTNNELPKLNVSDAVSNVVREMINNGQFEGKKDVIMGKIPYLNESTLELVKSKLSPEEQEKAQNEWDNFQKLLHKTPDMITEVVEELDEINSQYEKELEKYKKEAIKEQAKENGIELSEEEINSLNAEDLQKLVDAKITKRNADKLLSDAAQEQSPKYEP